MFIYSFIHSFIYISACVVPQELYETTLAALQEAKNERLWFKTNLKLGKLWFDR